MNKTPLWGGQRGTIPLAPNQYGGVKSLRGAPIIPTMLHVDLLFFKKVCLFPKDLRFEHGGAKLASCSGRHLTSLRPCSCPLVKYLSEVLRCAAWVVVPTNRLSLQEIYQLIGIELLTSSFLENWVLGPTFQGGENARFDHPANAHSFDVPRVQNCSLEFSAKAHP